MIIKPYDMAINETGFSDTMSSNQAYIIEQAFKVCCEVCRYVLCYLVNHGVNYHLKRLSAPLVFMTVWNEQHLNRDNILQYSKRTSNNFN